VKIKSKVKYISICKARLRNTSNALTFRMSGGQIRLRVPPKLQNQLFIVPIVSSPDPRNVEKITITQIRSMVWWVTGSWSG